MHPSPPSPQHLANHRERVDALRIAVVKGLAGRARITLEIGSGHGHYLTGFASAHPERFCVGIDLLLDRYERSERKRSRASLENLVFFRADAADFLTVLPPETEIEDVLVLFPDPWPKRRHHKNRLIQTSFLTRLARHVRPGGRLYFRTDDATYFAASRTAVGAHPDWQLETSAHPWPFELPTVFQQRADSYDSWIARRVVRLS